MTRIYEGYYHDHPVDGEITLLSNGKLVFPDGKSKEHTEPFYFFVIDQANMLKYCKCHGIVKYEKTSKLDDDNSNKTYIRKHDKWHKIQIPRLLPNINLRFLEPRQTECILGVPADAIVTPLSVSDFKNVDEIVSGKINVERVLDSATLAYVYKNTESDTTHIVYDILKRKNTKPGDRKNTKTEISSLNPLKSSNKLSDYNTKSLILIDANTFEKRNIYHTIKDVKEFGSIKTPSDLFVVGAETQDGVGVLVLRPSLRDDPYLPKDKGEGISRKEFDKVALYKNKFKLLEFISPSSNKISVVLVNYTRTDGKHVKQFLFVTYHSLYDKQMTISINVNSKDISNNKVNITGKVLSQLSNIPNDNIVDDSDNTIFYFDDITGFDIDGPSENIIVNINENEKPKYDRQYTISRKILRGSRPINIIINIHPELPIIKQSKPLNDIFKTSRDKHTLTTDFRPEVKPQICLDKLIQLVTNRSKSDPKSKHEIIKLPATKKVYDEPTLPSAREIEVIKDPTLPSARAVEVIKDIPYKGKFARPVTYSTDHRKKSSYSSSSSYTTDSSSYYSSSRTKKSCPVHGKKRYEPSEYSSTYDSRYSSGYNHRRH